MSDILSALAADTAISSPNWRMLLCGLLSSRATIVSYN